ncbi:UV DNA damage repair endonuclease UvsE [Fervidobacterium thailandense]|uniref:UV DNA damage repair endonuclease UvsE n=1 Tax=Fervidobacterium thailandense TaxID=1008305 RepID=A0A1E3G132_9BACT|nr:UV DNA damage repair endonuclease UvsE [Fervidobacterium thailandense]ODN29935.1 hypothetical protein A4H02_07980 [Fervidobacterium thailandense]
MEARTRHLELLGWHFGLVGLGFFCSTADGKISTNHTLTLKSLNLKNLLRTVSKNGEDFVKLLDISQRLGLRIFRLGSNFIPFASHESFSASWFVELKPILRELAQEIKCRGIRITMHPGQFVVLNSPREEVVVNSLKELKYHFWLLDELGVDENGVVVVHTGGTYGNKELSKATFVERVRENPWLLERLALENDERHFTVGDVLEISAVGLPVVFDYYHHKLNPSEFSVPELMKTWGNRIPEFHISSEPESPKHFGEHGNWLKVEDFVGMVGMFQGHRIDVIVEAKQKEIAIERLFNELGEYFGTRPKMGGLSDERKRENSHPPQF